MMKNYFFFLYLFFSCHFFSQNFGSVEDVKSFKQSEKIDKMTKTELLEVINQLEKFKNKEQYKYTDNLNKVIILSTLADCYDFVQNEKMQDKYNQEIIYLYEKSAEQMVNNKTHDWDTYYSNALMQYANSLCKKTQDLKSVSTILYKLKKVVMKDKKESIILNYYSLEGNIFYQAKLFKESIKSYQNAIIFYKKSSYKGKIPNYHETILNNISNSVLDLVLNNDNLKKEEKLKYLSIIDSNTKEIESLHYEEANMLRTYFIQAYSDYLKEDYQNAEKYIERSLKQKKEGRFIITEDYVFAKMIKVMILIKRKKYILIPNLKSEIEESKSFKEIISVDSNFKNNLAQYYKVVSEYEKERNNFQEAYRIKAKELEIIKQDRNEKLNLQFRELEKKYNISKKNEQIAELNVKKKSLTITLIFLWNLIMISAVFIFFYIRKKKRQSQKLAQHLKNITENEIHKINYAKQTAVNELKKKFSLQLHTDIGSALIATANFLKVKRKLEPDVKALELWDSLQKELQKIYTIVRNESHKIYESSCDSDFLDELEKNIQLIFANSNIINLQTQFDISSQIELLPETKVSILMMIKEGCTNIIKYSTAHNVFIKINNDENFIHVEIKDDGKKIFFSDKRKQGIGLQTLKETIENLNGKFSISKTESGFSINANMPYS
ncbi:sensor histidine kinase [Chryseobacterium gambrini]|uniref:sensor histidine kinase n=1 Tax=Chryseobacterium gambrini TaxID=373672 RepID=UPI003D14C5DF